MANTTIRLRQALGPLAHQWQHQHQQQSPPLLLQRQLQHGLSPRTRTTTATRSLTTTSSCLAKARNSFIPKMPTTKQPPQKSMNVAIQEQRATAEFPDDIGFLPGTFIMPRGAHLPSLASNPSGRYKLEKARFVQHTKDFLANTVMKLFYIRDSSRRIPLLSRTTRFSTWFRYPDLQRLRIPSIAKSLYEEMYTAFATGRVEALRPKLCENIYASLRQRVDARPPNTLLRWKLLAYNGRPRLVSHRLTPLVANEKDKYRQSTIQQAVVRIASMQSLQRVRKVKGRDGKIVEVLDEGSTAGDEGREVVEYFVIQRMTRKGVVGQWKIWGTTEEMTLERMERDEREKLGL